MNKLTFPDVNLWLTLASNEHVHSGVARRWRAVEPGRIAFGRITQIGFLRLLTSAAAGGDGRDRSDLTLDRALARSGAVCLLD